MKNCRLFLSTLLLAAVAIASCDGKDPVKDDSIDVSGISLPSSIEAKRGESISITDSKNSVKQGDVITLASMSGGGSFDCTVAAAGGGSFSFTLPQGITTGRYVMHIKRGSEDKTAGVLNVRVKEDYDIEPGNSNLYGLVSCDGKGVPGVVVSDGVEVVKTDANGVYHITSLKELGYVFISIPSGYEAPQTGILPKFHTILTGPKTEPERADFTLTKVSNDKFKIAVIGDIHLADRNNDRTEFYKFTADIRDYKAANPNEKIYGLTLGDMTWDRYWYSNSYYFPQYLADMNSEAHGVDGLPVFHTIGNHDHDMNAAGDFDTELKYVRDIAPTYYSFNIGKVHFIVLDDILCTNSGTGDRTYDERLDDAQNTWLKKDLATVAKTTPIVVTMHAPIYHDNSAGSSITPTMSAKFSSFFSNFAGYSVVHLITGHTHRILNVDATTSGSNYFEHNDGAVCATWWWTQKYNKVNVGTDGAPGGWELWEVDGTSFKWQFRATKEDPSFQMRSYDLNNICFDKSTVATWLPKGSAWAQGDFVSRYGSFFPKRSDNKVLLNIWNYDPKWTIKVTEKTASGDKQLSVKQVKGYDPLHIAAMSVTRYNDATLTEAPSFISVLTTHLFEVQASSATSTLEIEVKDRFGNVYHETMTRPKEFSVAAYRTNYYTTY